MPNSHGSDANTKTLTLGSITVDLWFHDEVDFKTAMDCIDDFGEGIETLVANNNHISDLPQIRTLLRKGPRRPDENGRPSVGTYHSYKRSYGYD